MADRLPNEVTYAQQGGTTNPYAMRVARMDAHGGWIANPTDLLRIMLRFDGSASKPDLLQPSTIATMTNATTAPRANGKPANYAKGWGVHPAGNWFHQGSLPGSVSELVRTSDGFCWAILANTRDESGPNTQDQMLTALDQLGWRIKAAITDWPAGEEI